jgi:hypothetical protein
MLTLALAVAVLVSVAFLAWTDGGGGAFEETLAGRPGFEGTAVDVGLHPVPGTKSPLGPWVAGVAGVAWLAALVAHLGARRGDVVRARQAMAFAFAAFLVCAILAAVALARGPGEPVVTRARVAFVPRFGPGPWAALAGAVLGAASSAAAVVRTRLPAARPPRPAA